MKPQKNYAIVLLFALWFTLTTDLQTWTHENIQTTIVGFTQTGDKGFLTTNRYTLEGRMFLKGFRVVRSLAILRRTRANATCIIAICVSPDL